MKAIQSESKWMTLTEGEFTASVKRFFGDASNGALDSFRIITPNGVRVAEIKVKDGNGEEVYHFDSGSVELDSGNPKVEGFVKRLLRSV